MNNTRRTDFENLRIPTLENLHRGITHKVEVLQEKLSVDMGIPTFYNILPRNFSILPVEKCSLHDIQMLEDLHEKQFNCFWTLEEKKAAEQNELDSFDARFRFYSFVDLLNDNEINNLYIICQKWNNGSIMTSHDIIEQIKKNPNFLQEVYAL